MFKRAWGREEKTVGPYTTEEGDLLVAAAARLGILWNMGHTRGPRSTYTTGPPWLRLKDTEGCLCVEKPLPLSGEYLCFKS